MKVRVIHDGCNRPYLVRLTLLTLFGYSLKLHIILRSDEDREMHDHPWSFWTLVLSGGYFEETPAVNWNVKVKPVPGKPWSTTNLHWENDDFTCKDWHGPGSLRLCKTPHPHRLDLPTITQDAALGEFIPAVTLVLTCPKKREWGFYTLKGWIPWFEFNPKRDC